MADSRPSSTNSPASGAFFMGAITWAYVCSSCEKEASNRANLDVLLVRKTRNCIIHIIGVPGACVDRASRLASGGHDCLGQVHAAAPVIRAANESTLGLICLHEWQAKRNRRTSGRYVALVSRYGACTKNHVMVCSSCQRESHQRSAACHGLHLQHHIDRVLAR